MLVVLFFLPDSFTETVIQFMDSAERLPETPPSLPEQRIATDRRIDWVLHVYAAFAMAVAGPIYSRLQQRVSFLISFESASLIAFVTVFSVVAPTALLLMLWGMRSWHRRLGDTATQSVLGCALGLVVATALSRTLSGGGLGWILVVGCVAVSYAGVRCYNAWPAVRSFLSVVAVGSVLMPGTLLWTYVHSSARPNLEKGLTVKNPVPIVMVVFDCFCGVSLLDQDRQIDVRRYPQFARLASMSNWYRNCTTVHPRTSRAVPAILTGNYPDGERAATVQQYPQNLFTVLDSTREYRLTSFEPFTQLCPADKARDRADSDLWSELNQLVRTMGAVFLHDIVPPDIPLDPPPIPLAWNGLRHTKGVNPDQRQGLIKYSWDVRRDRQFDHFLNTIRDAETSDCWFGHFALPHFPWNYLPSGNVYVEDLGIRQEWGTEGIATEDWAADDFIVLQAQQQYLLQLGYTDKLIGKLLDHLRATNLLDKCLLIVVADHGISFRPGISQRIPTEKNLADVMSVPLFVKLPGQHAGDIVDWSVETIDVLPTILDVLQLSPAKPVQGQSLVATEFRERAKKKFTNAGRVLEIDATFDSRHELLIDQLAKFGTGRDPLRIFKIGPNSELVGRSVDQLTVGGKSEIQIRPVNFAREENYTGGTLIPCLLEAQFESAQPSREGVAFAVAVNDTIWGTTQSYRVAYLQEFWRVMLPEAAIQVGPNRFRVFEIMKSSQGTTLAECPIGTASTGPKLPDGIQ